MRAELVSDFIELLIRTFAADATGIYPDVNVPTKPGVAVGWGLAVGWGVAVIAEMV